MVSGRNRRLRDIQRDIRPEQGGEFFSEFAVEVLWPFLSLGTLMILALLTFFL